MAATGTPHQTGSMMGLVGVWKRLWFNDETGLQTKYDTQKLRGREWLRFKADESWGVLSHT